MVKLFQTSGITYMKVPNSSWFSNQFTLTTKTLQEETSSRYFLLTQSRYRTSVKPLAFARVCAFNTYKSKQKIEITYVSNSKYSLNMTSWKWSSLIWSFVFQCSTRYSQQSTKYGNGYDTNLDTSIRKLSKKCVTRSHDTWGACKMI